MQVFSSQLHFLNMIPLAFPITILGVLKCFAKLMLVEVSIEEARKKNIR